MFQLMLSLFFLNKINGMIYDVNSYTTVTKNGEAIKSDHIMSKLLLPTITATIEPLSQQASIIDGNSTIQKSLQSNTTEKSLKNLQLVYPQYSYQSDGKTVHFENYKYLNEDQTDKTVVEKKVSSEAIKLPDQSTTKYLPLNNTFTSNKTISRNKLSSVKKPEHLANNGRINESNNLLYPGPISPEYLPLQFNSNYEIVNKQAQNFKLFQQSNNEYNPSNNKNLYSIMSSKTLPSNNIAPEKKKENIANNKSMYENIMSNFESKLNNTDSNNDEYIPPNAKELYSFPPLHTSYHTQTELESGYNKRYPLTSYLPPEAGPVNELPHIINSFTKNGSNENYTTIMQMLDIEPNKKFNNGNEYIPPNNAELYSFPPVHISYLPKFEMESSLGYKNPLSNKTPLVPDGSKKFTHVFFENINPFNITQNKQLLKNNTANYLPSLINEVPMNNIIEAITLPNLDNNTKVLSSNRTTSLNKSTELQEDRKNNTLTKTEIETTQTQMPESYNHDIDISIDNNMENNRFQSHEHNTVDYGPEYFDLMQTKMNGKEEFDKPMMQMGNGVEDYPYQFSNHDNYVNIPSYDHYHHYSPSIQPLPTTEKAQPIEKKVKKYTFYYIGRKIWYIPLAFSVWFTIYCFWVVTRGIMRHKVDIANHWQTRNGGFTFDKGVFYFNNNLSQAIMSHIDNFIEKYLQH